MVKAGIVNTKVARQARAGQTPPPQGVHVWGAFWPCVRPRWHRHLATPRPLKSPPPLGGGRPSLHCCPRQYLL